MNLPPTHIGRTPESIISEHGDMDSVGHMFRAMSWLDYYDRNKEFSVLLYASIEARYSIEYLLFEQLVLSTGANLSREDYEKCLKSSNSLKKTIDRLCPYYEKLSNFTVAITELDVNAPKIVQWSPKELMKSWGILSERLHWVGQRHETTQNDFWLSNSLNRIKDVVNPIWEKMTSGRSGMLYPNDMRTEGREIWNKYESGKITLETAKFEMNILKPMLDKKYP
jgi:hypothetical protein